MQQECLVVTENITQAGCSAGVLAGGLTALTGLFRPRELPPLEF